MFVVGDWLLIDNLSKYLSYKSPKKAVLAAFKKEYLSIKSNFFVCVSLTVAKVSFSFE